MTMPLYNNDTALMKAIREGNKTDAVLILIKNYDLTFQQALSEYHKLKGEEHV